MAKTLAQIIADVRQHINQPDSTNSNFQDSQLTIWINDAYRRIVTELRNIPITTRDYSVAAQDIALNSNTLTIDKVKLRNPDVVNPDGTYKFIELRQINLDELMLRDPDYEDTTADFPQYFVRTGVFTASLYPKPKASVIALATPLRTYGLELPTELAADADTPNLPGNLHDIISHWPAFRCFSELENQVKATEQITLFNSGIKNAMDVSGQFSRALKRWRWEDQLA